LFFYKCSTVYFDGQIVITEKGYGYHNNNTGVNFQLSSDTQPDTGPGGLTSALTYDLSFFTSFVAGDYIFNDSFGNERIIIRFNPAESSPAGGLGVLVIYANVGDGVLADTGFPTQRYGNQVFSTPITASNAYNVQHLYKPTTGQPGYTTTGSVTYVIVSQTTVTFNENGAGVLANQISFFSATLLSDLRFDIGSGGQRTALTYDLATPFKLITGDVFLYGATVQGTRVLLRFNYEFAAGGGNGSLVVYSNTPGVRANTGFPTGNESTKKLIPVSSNTPYPAPVFYTPGETDPGFASENSIPPHYVTTTYIFEVATTIQVSYAATGSITSIDFYKSIPGSMILDPGPGIIKLTALTFDILNPPSLTSGDLILSTFKQIAAVIRFNGAEFFSSSSNTGGIVFYYSPVFPDTNYTNQVVIKALSVTTTYHPSAGQPGYISPGDAIYVITLPFLKFCASC